MIKKKKKYKKPRTAYNKERIEGENQLIEKYGLKNKREIWKADASIERIRSQAKKLITASTEEQEKLFKKLNKIGLRASSMADILALDKEDWLKRRLQSILVEKKLAKPKEARQLIAHKHVVINGRIINIPSYIVRTDEEDKIKIVKKWNSEKKAGAETEKLKEKKEEKK
jgi:small subunit ribosomal protein S4